MNQRPYPPPVRYKPVTAVAQLYPDTGMRPLHDHARMPHLPIKCNRHPIARPVQINQSLNHPLKPVAPQRLVHRVDVSAAEMDDMGKQRI